MGFWDSYTEVQQADQQKALAQMQLQNAQTQNAGQSGAGAALFGGSATPQAPQGGLLQQLGSRIGSLVGGAQPGGGGAGAGMPGATPPQPGGQGAPPPSGGPSPGLKPPAQPAPAAPPQGGAPAGGSPQGGQGQQQGSMDLPTIVQRINAAMPNASPAAKMAALQQALPLMTLQARMQYQQLQQQLAAGRLEENKDYHQGTLEQRDRSEEGRNRRADQSEAGRNSRFNIGEDGKDNRQLQSLRQKDSEFQQTQQRLRDQFSAAQDDKAKTRAMSALRENAKNYFSQQNATINATKAGMPKSQVDDLTKTMQQQRSEFEDQMDNLIKQSRGGTGRPPPGGMFSGGQKPVDDNVRQQYQQMLEKYPDRKDDIVKHLQGKGYDTSGL